MTYFRYSLLLYFILSISPLYSQAAYHIPTNISYHGFLSVEGIPWDGSTNFTFGLYKGGTEFWSSGEVTLPVQGGVYNYSIGISPSLLYPTNQIGIQVKVGTETLTPNTVIRSVPYAIYALRTHWSNIDGMPVEFQDGTDDVDQVWNTNTIGINTLGGNVGIGTVNPLTKLVVSDGSAMFVHVGATIPGISGVDEPVLALNRYDGIGTYNSHILMTHYDTPTGGYGLVFKTTTGAHTIDDWDSSGALSDRMFIGYNGNVGIGTTSPTELLEVAGKVKAREFEGFGIMPVGSIIAWHKDIAGAPTEAEINSTGRAVCDGTSTAEVPGALIASTPDLNGQGRFLRGSSASGNMQTNAFQAHRHTLFSEYGTGLDLTHTAPNGAYNQLGNFGYVNTVSVREISDHPSYGAARFDSETRPDNMSVVWIMRVR